MNNQRQPGGIEAKGKTVRELLGGRKYSIDYFQREYKWKQKQVAELIDDLAGKFLESHEDGAERSAVAEYGHYFLGSVIVSEKGSEKFIIDGQQRLTTLTLLLIYLQHHIQDGNQKAQVADLIFSQKYGERSFNLNVPERTICMEALYNGQPFEENGHSESVVNVLARYSEIQEHFPEGLSGDAQPYFLDWLIENVHLVEITAFSDEDAYTIFETMNDRGLSLTPTEMLKGYLLTNISDQNRRTAASQIWKDRVAALLDIRKDEDADGIKSWLRSQYAESIRDRKRNAAPGDFDLIGTQFHRWVRQHALTDSGVSLGLRKSSDFSQFIERDFAFYSQWYERLRRAGEDLKPEMESIYYNSQNNFTLQYAVLLAPLRVDDPEQTVLQKIKVVSAYIDILIYRRIWNFRAIDYSTMQYSMFLVMREIRGKNIPELIQTLRKRLDSETDSFDTNDRFYLHGMNGRQIHRLLARMIDYVETKSGMLSRYTEYSQRGGKHGYEIEHIWSNHPEQHTDEFSHAADFEEYRNRIGDLLLLPKSSNASLGDASYAAKREHYDSQNLLARSLYEKAYDHNPGFRRFIDESGLLFKPHSEFKKADLDARQELYRRLAEQIWNPDRLLREASLSRSIGASS